MSMEIETIKSYLKVDNDAEDELISLLESTAKTYMQEYGIAFDEANPVHNLLILNLIAHFYENRANPSSEIPFTVKTLLQHCGLSSPTTYPPETETNEETETDEDDGL